MTVLDPRPWSPASAHIGPDEEDLAMLDPTGDPEADFGSAVLAVHRVGGAAAEAVARAPLPDEYRLIGALARAREKFAPRAVEAVSKCLGRDDVYPDLLLKDLFDAGEEGALAVYRACVSKGVAPPLAAQRAGLVYGVPHGELGHYLSVAADPKSHPIALADAADRAVTHWAAGVVREELAEPVAKQTQETVTEYNVTPFGQEHPKDRRGRFVDVLEREGAPTREQVAGQPVGFLARLRRDTGVGAQAAPEVAGEPVAVVAPPPVRPAPVRAQRRQRAERRTREEVEGPQLQTRLQTSLKSRLTASLGTRLQSRLDTQRARREGVEPLQEVRYGDEADISRQFTHRLGSRTLAWSMSQQQADEIFERASGGGTEDKPKHVQMGQLQQILAEPLEWSVVNGSQHQESMLDRAEEVGDPYEARFVKISGAELDAAGISSHAGPDVVREKVDEHARLVGYYDQLARDPSGASNPLLKANMGVAPSADPNTGDWYVVMQPEAKVYGTPMEESLAAAAEFVVADDSGNTARLNIEQTQSGPPYYEMDPTQHWMIQRPQTLWKQVSDNAGYWVDRYTVTPLEDWGPAGKAVATQQRWRTEPRNAEGEWTSGGFLARVAPAKVAEPTVVTPVVTPIELPRARVTRRERAERRARQEQAEAPLGVQLSTSLQTKLPTHLLRAFHTGLTEDDDYEVIDTSMPAWDDRDRYVVFSADEWDHLLRQASYRSFRNEIVPRIPLDGASRAHLLGRARDAVDGTRADDEVRLNVENEIMVRHKDERRELRKMHFEIHDDDPEAGDKWYAIGKKIRNLMASDQNIQSVRIDPGFAPGHYRVMANKHPVSDVIVVILPDDFDLDRPVTLEFTGRARQSALNRNIDRHYDEALHVDAPVQMFRATQGTKAIYHARQDERE